jgi:hypothetical protein
VDASGKAADQMDVFQRSAIVPESSIHYMEYEIDPLVGHMTFMEA